jgi:hypothetical protein
MRPRRELSLRAHVLCVDQQPTVHLPAAHLHRPGARRGDQGVRRCRVGAHEETALTARRHGHVAADQERETAEHLPLGQAALAGEQLTRAVGEFLVVRHGAMLQAMVPRPRAGPGVGDGIGIWV